MKASRAFPDLSPRANPRGLRAELFAQQQGLCHYCGRPMRLPRYRREFARADAATLDHVVPRAKGGSNHRSNLVLACRACNEGKGMLAAELWEKLTGVPGLDGLGAEGDGADAAGRRKER